MISARLGTEQDNITFEGYAVCSLRISARGWIGLSQICVRVVYHLKSKWMPRMDVFRYKETWKWIAAYEDFSEAVIQFMVDG